MNVLIIVMCCPKKHLTDSITYKSFQMVFKNINDVTPIYTRNNEDEINDILLFFKISGIIIGGSESRVLQKNRVDVPDKVFKSKVPILGICYGFQLMIERMCKESSIGTFKNNQETKTTRYLTIDTPILKVPKSKYHFIHYDFVEKIPNHWSKDIVHCGQIWMAHYKNMIGVQFHPEKYPTSAQRFFSNWIKLLQK